MYIEHPYFYEGKYYANIDGEMIEITKEVEAARQKKLRSRTNWVRSWIRCCGRYLTAVSPLMEKAL